MPPGARHPHERVDRVGALRVSYAPLSVIAPSVNQAHRGWSPLVFISHKAQDVWDYGFEALDHRAQA